MLRSLVPIALLTCTSCYTPMWMGRAPKMDGTDDKLHKGIVVFLPKRSIVTFAFTKHEDPKTHAVTSACDVVEFEEIVMLPNTEEKYRLRLWQPWIGSSESGVTLADGVVTNVTQKADTKIPETIGAIADLASTVAGIAAGGAGVAATQESALDENVRPACNTSKLVKLIDGVPVAGALNLPPKKKDAEKKSGG